MDLKRTADWLEKNDYPKFRLRQISDAVYKKAVCGFDGITALPVTLRAGLKSHFRILAFEPETVLESKAGNAVKASFLLKDGLKIESALLSLFPARWSVCVSTQDGCPVQCPFCATGRRGLKRNLSPDEIISQYLFWAQYLKKNRPREKITGAVFMGMGEPFLNYDSVAKSIRTMTDPDLIGLGDRRLSVSTAGHVPGIRRFAKDFPQANLALSLHAVDDALRSRLVPLNEKYPLDQLVKALRDYIFSTRRKVFIEYALLDGINDSQTAAKKLSEWIKSVENVKYFNVNLIPYNDAGRAFRAPARERSQIFANLLLMFNIQATLRHSLGADIKGACGQLAGSSTRDPA
ncbi:MAG: 23S rRNA (adenine(2503)-C(2))-methyltransferase RlmN [Elusimicrobia bacterium]|nr:23S rRNA (adenine(2503)-C(2))-methyltransferase RlmN [Elusimicrobiota bacterium]